MHCATCNCSFCKIVNEPTERKVCDTVLYETDNFIVVPALGAMTEGYLMVVSKNHQNSMCYCSDKEQQELIKIINKFRGLMQEEFSINPIVFEHGASILDTNKSACCILHAHIHIVPWAMSEQLQHKMCDSLQLNKVRGYNHFFELGKDKPYLLFVDNNGNVHYNSYEDTIIPSQIIRQYIATDIGDPKIWDWRRVSLNQNVLATIDIFRRLLKAERKPKMIYFARSMDGEDRQDVIDDYAKFEAILEQNGMTLVNSISRGDHTYKPLELNRQNAERVVHENMSNLNKSDAIIVSLTKPGHMYVGCIVEMIYAFNKGLTVIVVEGETQWLTKSVQRDPQRKLLCRTDGDVLYENSDAIVATLDEALDMLCGRRTLELNPRRTGRFPVQELRFSNGSRILGDGSRLV